MFEFIIILSLLRIRSTDSLVIRRPSHSLARVATPAWTHATSASTTDKSLVEPWPVPEMVVETVDGIPPSPAILSALGFKNAAGAFGSFFGGPLHASSAPIDGRNDPTDLSPVTGEVAALIAQWERASSPTPRVFEFHRMTYDMSRQVETRATGYLKYVSPDEGALSFTDENRTSKPVSERKNAQGKRFVYEASSAEEWEWSKQEVLHINNTRKTYAIAPLPVDLKGKLNGLLRQTIEERAPFIISVRDEVIRREWSFTLLRRTEKECYLEAIPRTAERRSAFHKCLIRLDAKSGQLTAIKYIDADQVHETVYVLTRCREQNSQTPGCFFRSREDRLKRYVLVPTVWQ